MSTRILTDVIILGAGPVGMFAVTALGMRGLKSILIDSTDELGGQCIKRYPEKYIYDIAGFPKILAKELIAQLEEQMMRFKPEIYLNTDIKSITKTEDGFVVNINGEELCAKVIVLARGDGTIKPLKPVWENIGELEASGHVQYALSDMSKFTGKTVLVCGGGDSALDWCRDLVKEHGAEKTYLVHRRDKLKASEQKIKEVSELANVQMMLGHDIESVVVNDDNGKLSIRFKDTDVVLQDVDYVVPCYGVEADRQLLHGLNFKLAQDNKGRVLVDPGTFETSYPGVYAVGDANTHAHKRYLITVGFAECFSAAYHAKEVWFGGRKIIKSIKKL